METEPKLYNELADWSHVLSPPEGYAEETAIHTRVLREHATDPLRTVLELGAGGGNNASHMKASFELTLVERSSAMVAQSRRLNPECLHRTGDMRMVRLDREFDAVFVHDAITYMTSEADLRRAMETAFVHCRAGGVALFAPDDVRETFHPETRHGGSDGPDRALRYLEWSWDPDPDDATFIVDYVYAMRRPTVRCDRARPPPAGAVPAPGVAGLARRCGIRAAVHSGGAQRARSGYV
jgi:SAM-dependent methyltransferase